MEEHFEKLAADLSELETDCINACLEYIKVQISYNKGFCEIDIHPSVVVFCQGEYKPVQVLAVYQEPHNGEVIAKLTSDMYLPVSSFELWEIYAIAEAIKLLKDGRN
jgi:hypothetical protein